MSGVVECPVCEVHFKAALIEQHVEHCLKVQQDKVVTRNQSLKKDIQPGIGMPLSTGLGAGESALCLQTGESPRAGIKGKKVTSPSQHGILKPKGQLDITALLQGPKSQELNESHKRKSKENFNVNLNKMLKTCSERGETRAAGAIGDGSSLSVVMQGCFNPSNICYSSGSASMCTSTTSPSLCGISSGSDPLSITALNSATFLHFAPDLSYIDSSSANMVASNDSSLDMNIDCTDQASSNPMPMLKDRLCNDPVQGFLHGNTHQSCPDTKGRLKSVVARLGQLGRIPLAELMRPCSLSQYIGQTQAIGDETTLRTLIVDDKIPSMILWGPPGCGKTTLAHIVSNICKTKHSKHRFVKLSATTAGIQDVKDVVKVAKNELNLSKKATVLFVDEIHRFNKLQQDAFLPHVENGTITLIGATTENPSFHVNNALLSRCRVVVLEKLGVEEVEQILRRAVVELHGVEEAEVKDGCKDVACAFVMEQDSIRTLANLCDGDARAALNCLDLTLQSLIPSSSVSGVSVSCVPVSDSVTPPIRVGVKHIKATLQRSHVQYDRNGDEHYNIISALHKSIRGNDENATLYWLARMLEGGEQPLYIARRLVRCASEDIGLADPLALNQSVAAYQACHLIGRPECDVILAQAAVYLARAPKSVEVYQAYGMASDMVRRWSGPQPAVPIHIRNAPTRLMRDLGYGRDYKYTPMCPGEHQDFLPPELKGASFFPSK